MEYVERGCVIEHAGRQFESGGAVITSDFIVAYPKANGWLCDWHGNTIGAWRIVAKWRVNSYVGLHMHQIESLVDGVVYTGRGFGEGMIYKGKRKAKQVWYGSRSNG